MVRSHLQGVFKIPVVSSYVQASTNFTTDSSHSSSLPPRRDKSNEHIPFLIPVPETLPMAHRMRTWHQPFISIAEYPLLISYVSLVMLLTLLQSSYSPRKKVFLHDVQLSSLLAGMRPFGALGLVESQLVGNSERRIDIPFKNK